MLEIVREEAAELRASPAGAETIGLMYAQTPEDIAEWMQGMRWSAKPLVSTSTLAHVMASLVDAGVLKRDQLLDPADLISHLSSDGDPAADAV